MKAKWSFVFVLLGCFPSCLYCASDGSEKINPRLDELLRGDADPAKNPTENEDSSQTTAAPSSQNEDSLLSATTAAPLSQNEDKQTDGIPATTAAPLSENEDSLPPLPLSPNVSLARYEFAPIYVKSVPYAEKSDEPQTEAPMYRVDFYAYRQWFELLMHPVTNKGGKPGKTGGVYVMASGVKRNLTLTGYAYYEGTDRGKTCRAHGSIRNGTFRGAVHKTEADGSVTTYIVEPPSKYNLTTPAGFSEGQMAALVYRDVDIVLHGGRPTHVDRVLMARSYKQYRPRTAAREMPNSHRVCQVDVVADRSFFQEYNSDYNDVMDEINFCISEANSIFEATDFNSDGFQDNIHIKLGYDEIKIDETLNLGHTNDATGLLAAYSEEDEFDYDVCADVLFTHTSFSDSTMGMAYVGGMCSGPDNAMFVTSSDTSGNRFISVINAMTFAHELGHLFGSSHDPASTGVTCNPSDGNGNYLMHPSSSSYSDPNNDEFSPCSISEISSVLPDEYTQPACIKHICEQDEDCIEGWHCDEELGYCAEDTFEWMLLVIIIVPLIVIACCAGGCFFCIIQYNKKKASANDAGQVYHQGPRMDGQMLHVNSPGVLTISLSNQKLPPQNQPQPQPGYAPTAYNPPPSPYSSSPTPYGNAPPMNSSTPYGPAYPPQGPPFSGPPPPPPGYGHYPPAPAGPPPPYFKQF